MKIYSNGKDLEVFELETSNTNLTSTITQVQNQVTAQGITNTRLSSVINELQNAIIKLTSTNTNLVTVNTRALNNTDIPHEPLPYDMEVVYHATEAHPASGGSSISFRHTGLIPTTRNWGSGLDFYVYGLKVLIESAAEPMAGANEGMAIYAGVNVNLGGTFEYMYGKTWNSLNNPFFYNSDEGKWQFSFYSPLAKSKVTSADQFEVIIERDLGVQFDMTVYVLGITK